MSVTATTLATPIMQSSETLMHNVDGFLRTVGYDLPSLISAVNFKSVGVIISILIFGIFVFDLLSYYTASSSSKGYGSAGHYQGDYPDDYSGTTYASYGRSLLTTAANIWDQRQLIGLEPYLRHGRTLDSMSSVTEILDSISDAVHKWDKEEKEKSANGIKSRILF